MMKKSMTILAAAVVLMAVGAVWADYDIQYTAELKGDSCIKFEDAMYLVDVIEVEPGVFQEIWEEACLGEDGVVETDVFVVTADGECEAIEVTVKAGKCKTTGTINLLDPEPIELCGFTVELVDADDGTYALAVTSDDDNETAALSNITFCFCDAVTAPEEGPYSVTRDSDYDEPTEPEEPEDD